MRYRAHSSSDDTIDARDLIRRLEELREARTPDEDATLIRLEGIEEPSAEDIEIIEELRAKDDPLDEEDAAELKALEDVENDLPDGETLIRESHFEEYARDMAESIEDRNAFSRWPFNCIDWKEAAEELKSDYSSLEFDGITYYHR